MTCSTSPSSSSPRASNPQSHVSTLSTVTPDDRRKVLLDRIKMAARNRLGGSLKVFLAGRVAVELDTGSIDERRFPGRQGRLLFAYLVAERGRAVPRGELADALWGEAPPPTWDKALTGIVSRLRAVLPGQG